MDYGIRGFTHEFFSALKLAGFCCCGLLLLFCFFPFLPSHCTGGLSDLMEGVDVDKRNVTKVLKAGMIE